MASTKIVLIGAGSTIFGVNTLTDLFGLRDHLRGSRLALCDVDAARLARVTRLAERMNAATGEAFEITGAADYRELLPGADFVIVSVEVDRLARWKLDWEIPFKYGVRHVLGENGGPGGLSHALRTIDLVLGIAQEVERLAPDATLINFTNPLPRVCLALTRYTRLKVIGLCHQINKGYYIVGHVLGLTPRLAEHFPPPAVAHELQQKLDLQTAGLNHFTWIQSMRERATGRDLYPEFRARLRDFDPAFEPLSRRLFDAFGLFPTSGDDHVGEYFAYAHETSDLKGYDFEGYCARGAELDARVERAATSAEELGRFLRWQSGERGGQVIAAIVNNWHSHEEVVNVVNHGALPGLSDWAVVEAPAILGADGATPVRVPALPPAITALLNQQVVIQDRVVEAAVHGDRHAALEALLLDPLTASYADAEKLLDELLRVHADHLPRFAR
ncbi:MAG: alpha-glucosidase/alpha-galactosidase [Chloroflexi bacterium]|nr:alpha-glucosidase/alpha-galactosidase [Chloroflexota bacterium]